MMAGRLRRRSGPADLEAEEGPFVSFTDLFIGILFLFLILVAALMLMHKEAVQSSKVEAQTYAQQLREMLERIRQLQATLDATAKADADRPPFRLAMVYNLYQKDSGVPTDDWTFSRTVQVFVAPPGLCLSNIILTNNLSLAWMPQVKPETIPTASSKDTVQTGAPCRISASGDHWNTELQTGGVERVSANLYSGYTNLHKKEGDKKLDLEYRILGVYGDYFRRPTARSGRP